MKCPYCGRPGVTRRGGRRRFLCKTGPKDPGVRRGVPFFVTLDDCEWSECPHCRRGVFPVAAVARLQDARRAAVARLLAERPGLRVSAWPGSS